METERDKKIEEMIRKIVPEILRSSAFTDKKITDTPTDALSTVNRRFVTLNGVTGSRPPNPIIGQFYYDTTLDSPIWWNGSAWKQADGTSV